MTRNIRILIVDEFPTIRRIVKNLLNDRASKTEPNLARAAVPMLTAEAKHERIREAAQADVNSHIGKPLNGQTLLRISERVGTAAGVRGRGSASNSAHGPR